MKSQNMGIHACKENLKLNWSGKIIAFWIYHLDEVSDRIYHIFIVDNKSHYHDDKSANSIYVF